MQTGSAVTAYYNKYTLLLSSSNPNPKEPPRTPQNPISIFPSSPECKFNMRISIYEELEFEAYIIFSPENLSS